MSTTRANVSAIQRANLIRLREALGLTPAQLAREIGVSRQSIYRIESGDRHPSYAVMLRWLAVLGPKAKPDLFFTRVEADDAA